MPCSLSARARWIVPLVTSLALSAIGAACGGSSQGAGGSASGGAPSTATTGASVTATTSTVSTTSASATGTTGAGGAGGCANLPLCDDFEGAAPNGPPDPTKWAVVQPDCGGGPATLTIDDTVSHSGGHSVRVEGGIGYCDHLFFADQTVIPALGQQVYARFFIRFADPIGNGHVTFLSMKDTNAAGKNLRMGGQGHVFMYNRESDDAVVPSSFGQSTQPDPATWYCVELHVDGQSGQIETWLDGVSAPGLRVDGTPTTGIDDVWIQNQPGWKPALADFRLGWESYSNQAMTVWFDDVALSTTRIGCN